MSRFCHHIASTGNPMNAIRCSMTTTMSLTFLRSMRVGGNRIGDSMNWPSVTRKRSTDQPHSLSVRRIQRSGTMPNTSSISMKT